jgi:hypothetical protein
MWHGPRLSALWRQGVPDPPTSGFAVMGPFEFSWPGVGPRDPSAQFWAVYSKGPCCCYAPICGAVLLESGNYWKRLLSSDLRLCDVPLVQTLPLVGFFCYATVEQLSSNSKLGPDGYPACQLRPVECLDYLHLPLHPRARPSRSRWQKNLKLTPTAWLRHTTVLPTALNLRDNNHLPGFAGF